MEPSRAAQVDIYRQQLGKKPATYWRFQVTSLKRGMIKIALDGRQVVGIKVEKLNPVRVAIRSRALGGTTLT
jgi:hypothetical protein